MTHDLVNHPDHYTSHPSGAECIEIAEWFPFNVGNAIKYLWRAGRKGDRLEDLRKARWYVDREITRLETARNDAKPDHDTADPIRTAWGTVTHG